MLERKYSTVIVVFFLSNCLIASKAVPVKVVNVEGNSLDTPEISEDIILDEDDSTTHNLERLVSAAPCLVAGVEYTHGQQIYRENQCEFCLCLDGEMFCWWQECPPEKEGPCKDRRPFSPCANGSNRPEQQQSTPAKTTMTHTISSSTQKPQDMITTSDLEETWSTSDNETSSDDPITDSIYTDESSTTTTTTTHNDETTTQIITSTVAPTFCLVMGTEYKIGEKLPHDTGNCLECICGTGARVTCSPHLCAPAGDDLVDYRPPGPRPDIPDSF